MPIYAFAIALISILQSYFQVYANYRDDPWRSIFSWAALGYAIFHVIMQFIYTDILIFGASTLQYPYLNPEYMQKGAIIAPPLLRWCYLHTKRCGKWVVRSADNKFGIEKEGDDKETSAPSLLKAAEQMDLALRRDLDRDAANRRLPILAGLAPQINFERDAASLVEHCFSILPNHQNAERTRVAADFHVLNGRTDIPSTSKSVSLMAMLLDLVGEKLLRQVVAQISQDIHTQCGPDLLENGEVKSHALRASGVKRVKARALENGEGARSPAEGRMPQRAA